jgi:hypothetical protein
VGKSEGGRGKRGGLNEYARQIGKDGGYIRKLRLAAEVYKSVEKSVARATGLLDKAKHLSAIHAAPQDTWPLLVDEMLKGGWRADDTEKVVKRVKELLGVIPEGWTTIDRLSVAGLAFHRGTQPLPSLSACRRRTTVQRMGR